VSSLTKEERCEQILYRTIDPKGVLDNTPALTTLLYAVCGNDQDKFAEATRLVKLFIEEAFDEGTQ
jgi:hypothetical protein